MSEFQPVVHSWLAPNAPATQRILRLQQRLLDKGWESLWKHASRMESLACDLALNWGVSPEAALTAVWGHDQMRLEPESSLLTMAKSLGVPTGPLEEREPVLLHGPLAAIYLQKEEGVADEAILNAVHYHTTLRAQPGLLEMILFVVDKVEPGKKGAANVEIFKLSYADLPSACAQILEGRDQRLERHGKSSHPDSSAFLRWREQEHKQAAS